LLIKNGAGNQRPLGSMLLRFNDKGLKDSRNDPWVPNADGEPEQVL
jgi:hypothetical protein